MSQIIHQRPKYSIAIQILPRTGAGHKNKLLEISKRLINTKAQIRFLIRCKKHNLIPNGLNRRFFISISSFSQSGRRLCQRFQWKLLLRILSDKHWMLHKYKQRIQSLWKHLEAFNLGSRFYFQTDVMIKKKMNYWDRQDTHRLSQKFMKLVERNATYDLHKKQLSKDKDARIQESKDFCDRKLVYNVSGKYIPTETEQLIGRLGFS